MVTTRLGGIEELLTHEESGLLVTAGDTDSLANALRQLLADAELRRRLAFQARKVIEERFELSASFARLRGLLQEAGRRPNDVPESVGVMATPSNAHRLYHR